MKWRLDKDEKPSRTRMIVSTVLCLALMIAWGWYRTETSDGAMVSTNVIRDLWVSP